MIIGSNIINLSNPSRLWHRLAKIAKIGRYRLWLVYILVNLRGSSVQVAASIYQCIGVRLILLAQNRPQRIVSFNLNFPKN